MWNGVAFILKQGISLSLTDTERIREVLKKHRLIHRQGRVYWGNPPELKAETSVEAARDVMERVPGIRDSLKAVQLLNIEDGDDVSAIEAMIEK